MTDERFTPFLSWTYSPETNHERANIIGELVHFVVEGVFNEYTRKPHEKAEAFSQSVRSYILTAHEPLMRKMPAKWLKESQARAGDTRQKVIEAFKEAQIVSRYDELLCVPPFRDENLRKHFASELEAHEYEVWKEAKPSVTGAFQKTVENLYQAETRLVAMYAIIQLIRADEFKHITLQGFDEIGQQLRMHRMTFMRNLAMFGGLLGGSPARFVAKLLARDACHKEDAGDVQYSLIHFLMPDGRIPGSWSSDAEDRFRADIKKHYDKLGD